MICTDERETEDNRKEKSYEEEDNGIVFGVCNGITGRMFRDSGNG